jgi:CII-binding regulator of phage lambda lysogenization HflD
MKPLSAITEKVRRPQPVKTEVQLNAETMLQELAIVYTTVGQMVENIAARCRIHGLDALLREIPDDADNVRAVLKAFAIVWPELSDDPFPELPKDPVVVETAEIAQ